MKINHKTLISIIMLILAGCMFTGVPVYSEDIQKENEPDIIEVLSNSGNTEIISCLKSLKKQNADFDLYPVNSEITGLKYTLFPEPFWYYIGGGLIAIGIFSVLGYSKKAKKHLAMFKGMLPIFLVGSILICKGISLIRYSILVDSGKYSIAYASVTSKFIADEEDVLYDGIIDKSKTYYVGLNGITIAPDPELYYDMQVGERVIVFVIDESLIGFVRL